jgi:hypothetical protein
MIELTPQYEAILLQATLMMFTREVDVVGEALDA